MVNASNVSPSIDVAEKSLITAIDAYSISATEPDSLKAEMIMQKIDQEMQKQITQSLMVPSGVSTRTLDLVYLGTDKTFTTADIGAAGKYRWGFNFLLWYGSDFSYNDKEATAAVLTGGPWSWGGAGAWAWIGKEFYVASAGSQQANIRMVGDIYGLTSVVGLTGSCIVDITLVVYDWNTGTDYTTEVYHMSGGSPYHWEEVDRGFNKAVNLVLQGYHTYRVYVLVETEAAVYGTAEAGSDFGPQDGDEPGHVRYYSITIDF